MESRESNHASLTHRRSFHDGLSNKGTMSQNPYEENKASYRRTSSLGVLTPDTETPEVPQTTVSPDLL